MATIQYTDQGTAVRLGPHSQALTRAALAARDAPSILNTQPWHWRIDRDVAHLLADHGRRLSSLDPDGRLLTLSCGVALHHARVSLAAEGVLARIEYLPDPDDPRLLATIGWNHATSPVPHAQRMRRAIAIRRSDRRPFADRPVPPEALDRLPAAAESAGAHLHLVRPGELVTLAVAAGHAADVESADPEYRRELATWVHDPDGTGDGVPTATVADGLARPVGVREFLGDRRHRASVYESPEVVDRHARYGVLYTDGDAPRDWLAAGEALSAVLLTATADGLATSSMSDLVEVPATRAILRRLLAGVGHPAIVVRIGMPGRPEAAPAAPRRPARDIVEVLAEPAGPPG